MIETEKLINRVIEQEMEKVGHYQGFNHSSVKRFSRRVCRKLIYELKEKGLYYEGGLNGTENFDL